MCGVVGQDGARVQLCGKGQGEAVGRGEQNRVRGSMPVWVERTLDFH